MNSMYPKKTNAKKAHTNGSTHPSASAPKGKRIEVRQSGIHGKGVFAKVAIAAGERIMEYTGKVITWKEAQRRHPHDPNDPNHTFYFHIDDNRVIDGNDGGNSAKWINHACGPNCEADQDDEAGRVFINAVKDIVPGEELNYDYGLILEGRHTPKVKKQFECRCGTPECRGTMLAPKR